MKYQDIEILLRQADCPPPLRRIIQYLHAENTGLKEENATLARGLDKVIGMINDMGTVMGLHQAVFSGLAEGKSYNDIVAGLRSDHLVGVDSEGAN